MSTQVKFNPSFLLPFQGAKQLYRIIVHPFLLKHEDRIDEYVTKAGQTGLDALRKVSRAGINRAATTVVNSAMMVHVCVCVCVQGSECKERYKHTK